MFHKYRGQGFKSGESVLQDFAIAIQRECLLHLSKDVDVEEDNNCHPKQNVTPKLSRKS